MYDLRVASLPTGFYRTGRIVLRVYASSYLRILLLKNSILTARRLAYNFILVNHWTNCHRRVAMRHLNYHSEGQLAFVALEHYQSKLALQSE